MRVLAFVDMHGSIEALRRVVRRAGKADILVCAGDITIFEQDIRHIVERLDKTGKPVLIVHGNHETEQDMRMLCGMTKNVKFIHKKVFEKNGIVFFGYGGGGFSQEEPEFARTARKLRKKIEGKRLVLVTHAPPYKTKVDNVFGNPCGNKTIKKFILKEKPLLVICGHLHENAGKQDRVGKTLVINPGPFGKKIIIR